MSTSTKLLNNNNNGKFSSRNSAAATAAATATANSLLATSNSINNNLNGGIGGGLGASSSNNGQAMMMMMTNLFNNPVDFAGMDENERSVVAEFIHLLEKSRQLFNGLRELPQYGHKNSQWQAYFGRTFDVYTKLWKFQQQNRQILDSKYNLKRWQIGEIASKIGQLYYHYYLRTSESNYLNEAYSFYQAIQSRAYYSRANKEEKPDLMVKKLRYYARFIVVCLLLKKNKQVKELIRELSKHIDDYVKIYDPPDQLEWQMVKNEINDFIDADCIVNVESTDAAASTVVLSNRLNVIAVPKIGPQNTLAVITNEHQQQLQQHQQPQRAAALLNIHLNLQEIIIVGNCQDQIKFSELSLDMFRMLQAVEREPSSSSAQQQENQLGGGGDGGGGDTLSTDNMFVYENREITSNTTQSIVQRENPHKYLLYKPTLSQFMTYMAASFKDLAPHGIMMIYLSADQYEPSISSIKHHHHQQQQQMTTIESNTAAYDLGGVRTNFKREMSSLNSSVNLTTNNQNQNQHHGNKHHHHHHHHHNHSASAASTTYLKESHCIYPGDLYPFLRKPTFLIVDSLNSRAFRDFPNLFGQPFVSLLSPNNMPAILLERQNQHGNLFTLFLTNPLFALCHVCNVNRLSPDVHKKAMEQIKYMFIEIAKEMHKCSKQQLDSVYLLFCQDDFIRMFILRYVFCYTALRLHRGFKGSDYYPSCQPAMPKEITECRTLQAMMLDLTSILNSRQLFLDID